MMGCKLGFVSSILKASGRRGMWSGFRFSWLWKRADVFIYLFFFFDDLDEQHVWLPPGFLGPRACSALLKGIPLEILMKEKKSPSFQCFL